MECVINSKGGKATVWIEPPFEHLQLHWKKGIFYEGQMLEYIRRHYRGGIFIDVGSCIGNHTLFFALFCNPSLVVSFEPNRRTYDHQMKILAMNNIGPDRIMAFNMALGNDIGYGSLESCGSNLGSVRLIPGKDVVIDTLDGLDSIYNWREVKLLKVDVEGYESRVLKGGIDLITRERPAIFVEARGDQKFEGITKILEPLGYGVTRSFNQTPTYEFISRKEKE